MWDFLKAGGPFMFLLVGCSIIGLAMIIERVMALRRSVILPEALQTAVDECRTLADLPRLDAACRANPSTAGRLLLAAKDNLDQPKEENVEIVQARARQEIAKMERGLAILEVVVGIAPLLGLVGTIHGMITLFGDLGKVGMADNTVLAKGISVALNTTLMGLIVAIPSLVAWTLLSRRVENFAVQLEGLCDKFVRQHYRLVGPR